MQQPQIVIVGAGIVGLATAFSLLKQGMTRVTVLEQASVDHMKAASHGPSRLLRFEYGADALYSEMVRLSLQLWKNLERSTGRTLYTPTGVLVLGNEDDKETKESYCTLQQLGYPLESLTRPACMQRYPQFNTQGYDLFIYNSNGGILHASACLRTLQKYILELGGTILERQRVTHVIGATSARPLRLSCGDDEVTADRVVLTSGPWVHTLLGELCLPIRLTRQYLLYFANLPVSTFGLHAFPSFMAGDLYGFPILKSNSTPSAGWLKAASHTFGPSTDPDEPAKIDEHVIEQTTRSLCERIPALHDAELAHIDSCIYDVSPDEHFILDYHPADARIIFAACRATASSSASCWENYSAAWCAKHSRLCHWKASASPALQRNGGHRQIPWPKRKRDRN